MNHSEKTADSSLEANLEYFDQAGRSTSDLAVPEKLPLQFIRGCGYWISPAGQIFSVGTHVEFICKHPALFGLTREQICQSFQEHDEAFGSEGNARLKLVTYGIQAREWIRVRHYLRRGWTVNLKQPDLRVADFFRAFAPNLPNENLLLDFPHERWRTTVAEFAAEYQETST